MSAPQSSESHYCIPPATHIHTQCMLLYENKVNHLCLKMDDNVQARAEIVWFTVGLVFKVRTVCCFTTKFFHGNDTVCLSRIEMKQISSVFTFQIDPVGVFVPSCMFLSSSWGICVVWLPV